MVKYYGRARTRTGSVNTNQLGLKMSGCPSRVGRNPVNSNYISRRVNCMQGICGTSIVNGKIWTKNFGLKNQFPYCKKPSNKCLAAAGGIGNINTPYYRTPAPGEKGCGLTLFEKLEQQDNCGEGLEFIAGILKYEDSRVPPGQRPGPPLSITGYSPSEPPIGSIINNSINQNIRGFINLLWATTENTQYQQTLIFAKNGLTGKSIKICRNGYIIKELKLGNIIEDLRDIFVSGYSYYVVDGAEADIGPPTPNAITLIPGQRYTIIE